MLTPFSIKTYIMLNASSAQAFSRNSHLVLMFYCFCAGLSIAASQIFVLIFLLHCAQHAISNIKSVTASTLSERPEVKLLQPIYIWLVVALIAALFGMNRSAALFETGKNFIYCLFPFAVWYSLTRESFNLSLIHARCRTYILCICASLTVAAIHTTLEATVGNNVLPSIPGPVTESGQLALIGPCVIYLLFNLNKATLEANENNQFQRSFLTFIYYIVLFLSLLLICWPNEFCRNGLLCSAATARNIGIFVFLIMVGIPIIQKKWSELTFHLFSISTAMLVVALLVNLKRGPWFGLFIGILIMGVMVPRKIIFGSLLLGGLLIIVMTPSRHRIKELPEHFAISGGRAMMWEAGAELSKRYPLGLGLKNARYMQEFDSSFPSSHRHMHNNFLNILVETGWLGLMTYLWWIFSAISIAYGSFRVARNSLDPQLKDLAILSLALGCSLISWQVAGTVEYNFGDAEIRLIAYLIMGLILSVSSALSKHQSLASR